MAYHRESTGSPPHGPCGRHKEAIFRLRTGTGLLRIFFTDHRVEIRYVTVSRRAFLGRPDGTGVMHLTASGGSCVPVQRGNSASLSSAALTG